MIKSSKSKLGDVGLMYFDGLKLFVILQKEVVLTR